MFVEKNPRRKCHNARVMVLLQKKLAFKRADRLDNTVIEGKAAKLMSSMKLSGTMKTITKHWLTLIGICGGGLIIVATALTALSQSAPVLTIAPLGTNQYLISITNGSATANYDLQWTPVLASTEYPWTWAAIGGTGQTNFTLDMTVYQTAFFRALLDTNSIPLWEAADPNNPSAGILTVFIDSPTNGSTITQ
jgi:hypothetical protein